jgi:hypothetical protein
LITTERRSDRKRSWWRRLRRRRWLFRGIVAALIIVVLLVILFGSITIWPDLGAKGTAAMRVVLGDRITAKIEGVMLSTADWFHRVEYAMGIGHNHDPLGTSVSTATTLETSTTTTTTTTTLVAANDGHTGATSSTLPPTTTTTEPPFRPSPVAPMGTLDNEGQWQPYITDKYDRVVAYRTVLQPDAKRGYAHAVVVALDVRHTSLHFVLGYEEPVSDHKFERPGAIPQADLKPGVILGAFNGGFQAKHGQFGAMADGQVALPARDGFGTIVLYKDGSVDLGAWGTDIQASPDMQSWRQNGPLMVDHGSINPHTAEIDPQAWGYVFGGGVATFRSAVGLSEDRRTLFFVIGPSLTTGSIAAAMHQAGVWNGIQLDINRPWTRFDKAVFKKDKLAPEAAVDGIAEGDYRLFQPYKRDFFYITVGAPPVG